MARYRVEPYVIAADVYSMPPHTGQGGWTWYTGSGSWMYRLGLEAILGFRRRGNVLRISPCIPGAWSGFTITYRHGASVYHIQVLNPKGVNRGVEQILLEGEVLAGKDIPLLDEKRRYEVVVRMG
jgi:cyclic beta-1,2-glucan synthetase